MQPLVSKFSNRKESRAEHTAVPRGAGAGWLLLASVRTLGTYPLAPVILVEPHTHSRPRAQPVSPRPGPSEENTCALLGRAQLQWPPRTLSEHVIPGLAGVAHERQAPPGSDAAPEGGEEEGSCPGVCGRLWRLPVRLPGGFPSPPDASSPLSSLQRKRSQGRGSGRDASPRLQQERETLLPESNHLRDVPAAAALAARKFFAHEEWAAGSEAGAAWDGERQAGAGRPSWGQPGGASTNLLGPPSGPGFLGWAPPR